MTSVHAKLTVQDAAATFWLAQKRTSASSSASEMPDPREETSCQPGTRFGVIHLACFNIDFSWC